MIKMDPEMARDERAILIQASGFVSTYAPYNLLRTYQLGGRFHFLNNGDDIAHEVVIQRQVFVVILEQFAPCHQLIQYNPYTKRIQFSQVKPVVAMLR